jgi:hypothetical protein
MLKKNSEENYNDNDNYNFNDFENYNDNYNYNDDLVINKEKIELNKCKMRISFYAVRYNNMK